MILTVDLGNYNIKTSEGICFPSTFTKDISANPLGEEILEYNGETFIMGTGEYDNTFNKSKKNYIPNLLYAIAKSSTKDDNEFNIVLGVPLDNLNITNNFKADLEDKEFNFVVNGIERKIKINKIATVGEGISSYYTLDDVSRTKDCLIIDIGGRTVNVCTFINKKLDKKFTVNKGIIDLYDSIKTRVNSTGENFNTEDIERLMKKDIIKDTKDDKNLFVETILNAIKLKLNKDTFDIFLTGGGCIELKEELKEYMPNCNFLDNPIFSNVTGNKKIALAQWRD